MRIRAITISQPYAELIASGEKWVENRVRPQSYRGPIAIHAGLGRQYLNKSELSKYDTGCIVAIGELVACREHSAILKDVVSGYGYLPLGNRKLKDVIEHLHCEGPFCLVLENVRRIQPIPYKGALGIWTAEIPDPVYISEVEGGESCRQR